jgi:hypothetical protein
MINKNELRRLARLHRLARQIAASLPADFDREQPLQVSEYAHRLFEWQHGGTPRPESARM